MYGLFIQIFIDAAIMWMVLTMMLEQEVSLGLSAGLGFGTALITLLLGWGLVKVMGPTGVFVALFLVAVLLGIALSTLFGLELKRAIMVAGIFMVAHYIVWLILFNMVSAPGEAAVLNEKLQVLLT